LLALLHRVGSQTATTREDCFWSTIFLGHQPAFLPYMHDVGGLSIFAVLFGLDYIATVPPTVMLVAKTFGRHNVGIVHGWVFAVHQLGAAMAAWIGGLAGIIWGITA
jgi:predicted MFS family arabinose efflux permease